MDRKLKLLLLVISYFILSSFLIFLKNKASYNIKQVIPDGSKIKIISVDLDGTLLNENSKVSDRTKEVVGKVLEKYPDLHFVISTGRPKVAITRIREALNITERPNTESLLSNGCVLYDSKGEIIWQKIIPTEFVVKFHEFVKSYPEGVYFFASGDDTLVMNEKWAKNPQNETDVERATTKKKILEDILSGNKMVNKVSFFFYKCPNVDVIMEGLQKLKKEYELDSYQPSQHFIEFISPNSNKGSGLIELMNRLNITKEEVIAFGDGNNDLELFQTAGWPIAMANACNELKPLARLTTKSNKEDGVAYMLERIFLNEELVN